MNRVEELFEVYDFVRKKKGNNYRLNVEGIYKKNA